MPDDIEALVAPHLAALGVLPDKPLQAIPGGKNNRLFEAETGDGRGLIIKQYNVHGHDPRDRLGAEWRFVNEVWGMGVHTVAEPLRVDEESKLAFYARLPGRKLAQEEITVDRVRQAACFIVDINRTAKTPSNLPLAAEACFSLAQHIETVRVRVDRLDQIDPTAPLADKAQQFVRDGLRPCWADIERDIEIQADQTDAKPDCAAFRSPSDFGFHNILADGDTLYFLDFEYAGTDDLAKLVNDFFCCPQIRVDDSHRDEFVDHIIRNLPVDEGFEGRVQTLHRVYQIKWICIILNDFLARGDAQRSFANDTSREQRCSEQLVKAEAALALMGAN